jgi:type I restriction enzyme S subunit
LENSAARLLPAGTVCLSRTASVGYVTVMEKPMATSQDFANWLCSDALMPEFLMMAFLAEGEHLLSFGRGSTHTTIYYPELKALHIFLPPLPEQHEIVRRLSAAFARLDAAASAHAAAVAALDRLDQSLLARAFSGGLVPQLSAD